MSVRSILAPNPGPLTLTGTRSYVVGGRGGAAAIVDPGPEIESHLARLAHAVRNADRVAILLTHDHADHAAGAENLAHRIGAQVLGPGGDHQIHDGQTFTTEAGDLVAVSTPGHSRRHFCFHLRSESRVFVGDLLLGEGDTTWVGEYRRAIADYLASLDRVAALEARTLHPAHGPDIQPPAEAIARFRDHRLSRIAMVRRALAEGHVQPDAITRCVYGQLAPEVHHMAVSNVEAILDYLSDAE